MNSSFSFILRALLAVLFFGAARTGALYGTAPHRT
jgi:hypothetical protein